MPRISSKHQVTLPVESLERAGLKPGDEVRIEADGPDPIVVQRIARDPADALGSLADGFAVATAQAHDATVATFDRRVRRALGRLEIALASQLNA
jgi:bifunctional DNA-binding transcriptional regulator/antitoxin component of YhaV-PrlF toxin-antitoxin module